MLEFLVGSEEHSSNWGKFYVRGLEKYEGKEDHPDCRSNRHERKAFLMADAPNDLIFTVFEQSGNKRGTDVFRFYLLATDSGADGKIEADYGGFFVTGPFRIVAMGDGKVKAPRLLDWWGAKPANVGGLAWATHCGENLQKRGLKAPPPFVASEPAHAEVGAEREL